MTTNPALERTVRDIYNALKARLPQTVLSKLSFKEPDHLKKLGSDIIRGRILPQRTKSIFDATWCFYEIGVGRYAAGRGGGGVGLVCFPDNKKCGKGIHTGIVSDLVTRYAAIHPSFTASQRGTPAQCVFTYYPTMQPADAPADDLAALIASTFPVLEQLSVPK